MTPEPNGSIAKTAGGRDLIVTRTLSLTQEEAWRWVTDSDRLEKWFGTWTGDGSLGGRVEVTMNAEEEESTSKGEITACVPGHSYELTIGTGMGEWYLGLQVEPADEGSTLTFIQHLDDETPIGSIGAGWEYYLDRLIAAIEGTEMPDFNDYWPAMGPYFEGL